MTVATFNSSEIENKIGYTFTNKTLLKQAFTRSSYAKEHYVESNEVLEFIGDSILGMIVTKHLANRYETVFELSPNEFICELNEAELSEYKISLVERSSLAIATEKAELHNYLLMGNNDIANNVQNQASVKEDLLEAILGAIAIDSNWNFKVLENVVEKLIDINSRLESTEEHETEYKKQLSEKLNTNAQFKETPSICKNLKYGYLITLGDSLLGEECFGYGNTKNGAMKMAANRALKISHEIGNRASIVKNAVGDPDPDRAINQLQELFQKKIIPEPKYTFTQMNKVQTGNPLWSCSCSIEGVFTPTMLPTENSKNKAKKEAAYDAINYLVGINNEKIIIKNMPKTVEETI